MTWNYRVVVRDGEYAIYEVYYDEKGNIEAFTEEPVYPGGESVDELREDLEHYRYALKQPVLDYKELSEQVSGFQSDDNSITEESVDEKADKRT